MAATNRKARKDLLTKYPFADSISTVESLLEYPQMHDVRENKEPRLIQKPYSRGYEDKSKPIQPSISREIQEKTREKVEQDRTKAARTEREIDIIRKEKAREKERLKKANTNIQSKSSIRQDRRQNENHLPHSRSRLRSRKHILSDPPFSWKQKQQTVETKDIQLLHHGSEKQSISKTKSIMALVDRLAADPIIQMFLPSDATNIEYFHYSPTSTKERAMDEARNERVFRNIWNNPRPETPTSSLCEETQSRSTISDNLSTDGGDSDSSSQSSNWLGLQSTIC